MNCQADAGCTGLAIGRFPVGENFASSGGIDQDLCVYHVIELMPVRVLTEYDPDACAWYVRNYPPAAVS